MTTTANENELLLQSQALSLNKVEQLIDQLREKYKVCEDAYGNMLVAITEAVNNAIYHGNKGNPDKKVKIRFSFKNDRLAFIVSDEGSGFDYYNVPDPTAPENIERPCGRGVYLMKYLTDQLIFAENGRVVELYFKIHNN